MDDIHPISHRPAGITALAASVVASVPAPAPGLRQTTLPGDPMSVQAARRFVQDALAGCPRVADLVLATDDLTVLEHTLSVWRTGQAKALAAGVAGTVLGRYDAAGRPSREGSVRPRA